MKFKNTTRQVPDTYTRDGITVPITRTETTRVPAFPLDWQVIALRSSVGIVLVLTVIAVAWSTWSIGSLLHGGIGYIAAVIFDLGWATSLLLEYLARYDKRKREFPKRLGWTLLTVTMAAIALDGLQRDSIPMAVIGAFVSLFAKCLWMGVMKHINAELSAEDEAWVTAQMSGAQAKAAVSQVRRNVARIEQKAALELMAMEREKQQVSEAFGLPVADATEAEAVATGQVALVLEPPQITDMNKADAVRFAIDQLADATPEQIAETLQSQGMDIDVRYVRQIIKRSEDNVIEFHK